MRLPPNFTPAGLLPPGDYDLTLDELRQSLLVVGHPSRGRRWNAAGRLQLVDNLAIMAGQLWQVGITEIFIDGSFVEDKASPNDIDGYFHCNLQLFRSGQLEQQLRQLDDIWTWRDSSRVFDRNSAKRQLPMWHKYRVELYPELWGSSGIPGPQGQPLPFSAAFRQRRSTYEPKGIVRLVR